ncbi:DUF5011 domain-containing protein [Thalassotalea fonticola]|uniref:DUF5011 domain-containing protein n=1 Tax=Thalassotalea fonticola TaxID=3065649 RepID=A0ABZ0GL52_9GAMM|nr:DUF5011 domain-containing protein [Colwelliaceae bacterium S1-1]
MKHLLIIVLSLLTVACGGGGESDTDTSPNIEVVGAAVISIYIGETYKDLGATAEDDIDQDINDKIIITTDLDTSVEGVYEVIYTVTDSGGNTATTTRAVEVKSPIYALSFTDPNLTLYEGSYTHRFYFEFDVIEKVDKVVNFNIQESSTAESDIDYRLISSEFTVFKGLNRGYIELELLDDDFDEGSEVIDISLVDPNLKEIVFIQITLDDKTTTAVAHNDLPSSAITSPVSIIDDYMYIMGSRSIDKYNLIDEVSSTNSAPAVDNSYGDSIVYNEEIYFYTGGSLYNVNEKDFNYELISQAPIFLEWTAELQVLNNELYVIGGKTIDESSSTIVQAFNFDTQTWSSKSDLNHNRYGGATGIVNGEIFVFGGNYSSGTSEKYDPKSNTWVYITANAKLAGSFSFSTAISNGNFIEIITSDISAETSVLRYNALADSWSEFVVDTPSKMSMDSMLYKGRTYLVGGFRGDEGSSKGLHSYYIGDN